MKTRPIAGSLSILTLLLLSVNAAHANATYSGTVSAVFTDPVLSGYVVEADGDPAETDNTGTAVYSITDSGSSSTLSEGDNFNGAGSPSVITFTGSSFSGVTPGEPFELGAITYYNGTSDLDTLIFGATLDLSVTPDQAITPASSAFGIISTANGGVNPAADADYLQFPALGIDFHVYEGASATAEVYGEIVGDPSLEVTNIQLGADQASGGFLSPVPEPSGDGWVLAGGGALLFVLRRRRRRRGFWC